MAHDDEAQDQTSIDPDDAGSVHDDDALADALAAQYTSLATHSIPIVPPSADRAKGAAEDWVNDMVDWPDDDDTSTAASADPVVEEAPEAAPEAVTEVGPEAEYYWEPEPSTDEEPHPEPTPEPTPEADIESKPAWDPQITPTFVSPFDPPALKEGELDGAAAPWKFFPAPDPTQAVELPDGPPQFLAASPVEDWPAPSFDEPDTAPHTKHDHEPDDEREPLSRVVSSVPAWEPAPWEPPVEPAAEQVPDIVEPVLTDLPVPVEPEVVEPELAEPESVEPESVEPESVEPELVNERPAPNAWTAWAPSPAAASEWDAAAPVSSIEPEPVPEFEAEPEVQPEAEAEPEPTEPEPEPEEFPWITAAVAAAAAQPLSPPVENEPFNWSISPEGKVAYEPSDDADPQEPEVTQEPDVEPEPESPAPEPFAELMDQQRMFSPPPLVEPPASLWAAAASPDVTPAEADPVGAIPESMFVEPSPPEAEFVPPTPVVDSQPVTTASGSIPVMDQAYDEELDDDVDDTDRGFANLLSGGVGAASVAPSSPPSQPVPTIRIPDDEPVFFDDEPTNARVFSFEHSGLEPTPVEARAGHAIRLFWLWFSANSSIVSIALGAAVFAAGMSLRQSIVAILAGVALSFLPLALTTLAGKRSGQPTMVVSRATFGLQGNLLPAALAVISRLFWGAVLLWLLATSVSAVLVAAGFAASEERFTLVVLTVAFAVALLVAFVGYPLLARIQLVLTIVAAALIIGVIALTAQYIDIPRALTVADGSWLLAIGGAVLVFSFVGLVWAHSGADLARYQRPSSSGAASMLSASFGTTVPAFVLIGYGAVLAASDPEIASGFATAPVQTLAGMLPSWYPIPLIAAISLSLLSGIVVTLYSGGLALQSVGVKLSRQWSVVVVGGVLVGIAIVMTLAVTAGIGEVFRDFATTMAVPTAAWIGIFGSEMMIRNRRFESESLLKRGGVYPDVRWVNLGGFMAISVIGFGLTTATVNWLSWQGYVFSVLGLPLDGEVASTDLGVLVALVLGLILPLATGIPAIRRQEAARV